MTETIAGFARAAADVPAIRAVYARSRGPHVDFVVVADGVWHQVIDELEPRLYGLIVEGGADFGYRVMREGETEIPVGYLSVYDPV